MGYSDTGIDLLLIFGKQVNNRMDLGYFVNLDGRCLFVQRQGM